MTDHTNNPPKFQIGDLVRKLAGSSWRGRVVGTYSTTPAPESYAVESEREPWPVQIYPAAALELAEPAPGDPPWYPDDKPGSVQIYPATALAAEEQPNFSGALLDIHAERTRQIADEGWTPEHDDEHAAGEMAGAAAAYALYRSHVPAETVMGLDLLDVIWPWSPGQLNPKSRRHDLVRAAALLLAEIERLDRAEARQSRADMAPRDD